MLRPGQTEERELSWNGSVGGGTRSGLSADGRNSPPVRLGAGGAAALSPDGTRVLADRVTPPGSLIYTVSAGDPVQLPTGGLTTVNPTQDFTMAAGSSSAAGSHLARSAAINRMSPRAN